MKTGLAVAIITSLAAFTFVGTAPAQKKMSRIDVIAKCLDIAKANTDNDDNGGQMAGGNRRGYIIYESCMKKAGMKP